MVPARVGAGPPDLALPDVVGLQRARRPPPNGAGNGGRGAEGRDEDGRPDDGDLGGRHVCQAAAAEARGRRRSAGMMRFNAVDNILFSTAL